MNDQEQDKKFSLKGKIKAALADSPEAKILQAKFKKLNLPSASQQLVKKPVLSDYPRPKPNEAMSSSSEKEPSQPAPSKPKRKKPRH